MIRAIETEYKGYRFRSRLEARWAVFFDACGVKWEYEPEGFDFGNGIRYLPDFILHDVNISIFGGSSYNPHDVYIEVKGNLTYEDAMKCRMLCDSDVDDYGESQKPCIIVGGIPECKTYDFVTSSIFDMHFESACHAYENHNMAMFSILSLHPCFMQKALYILANVDGGIVVTDEPYDCYCVDRGGTVKAYRIARQARFEHGENPWNAR